MVGIDYGSSFDANPELGRCLFSTPLSGSPETSLWRLSMTDCHGGYARTCWERISEANGERSAIKVKERVKAACGLYPRVWEAGAVSRWISLRTWSCGGVHGAPNHARASSTASSQWISTRTLRRAASRKTDSTAVAGATNAPVRSAASRSSEDYAARTGEPRGRKPAAGLGTENSSFPAPAEGEKRLRSVTQNP